MPSNREDGLSALLKSRSFQVICAMACLGAVVSLALSVSSRNAGEIAGFAVASVCFGMLFAMTVHARRHRS